MNNNGILFEKHAIDIARNATKSAILAHDYDTAKGTKVEVKFFTIKKAEDYQTEKATYNSAHAHKWVLNENGEPDYMLTVKAFTEEADTVKVGYGVDWEHCSVVWLRSKKKIFAFYFCRLQFQKGEENGRLCFNPLSNKAGGRERQLNTLRENGVVNVPTIEAVREMHKAVFGDTPFGD